MRMRTTSLENTARTHNLKIWPQYFQPVLNGRMRCQLRRADRDFKVGDYLLLQEWIPTACLEGAAYTGREVEVRVDHIMETADLNALMDRMSIMPTYVIMSISLLP